MADLNESEFYKRSPIEEDFVEYENIEDDRFGEIIVLQHKENADLFVMAKEKISGNVEDFKKDLFQAEQRKKLNHPNLLEMPDFCTSVLEGEEDENNYLVCGFYEYPERNLETEIKDRIKENKAFEGDELLRLIEDIMGCMYYLQKKKMLHGDIRPKYIAFEDDEMPNKLVDRLGDPYPPNKVQIKVLKKNLDVYMSPILFKSLSQRKSKIKHNPYKSEVFSFGIVLLETGLLKNVGDIYDREKCDLNVELFMNYIEEFLEKYQDFVLLQESLLWMLDLKEKTRTDPKRFMKKFEKMKIEIYGNDEEEDNDEETNNEVHQEENQNDIDDVIRDNEKPMFLGSQVYDDDINSDKEKNYMCEENNKGSNSIESNSVLINNGHEKIDFTSHQTYKQPTENKTYSFTNNLTHPIYNKIDSHQNYYSKPDSNNLGSINYQQNTYQSSINQVNSQTKNYVNPQFNSETKNFYENNVRISNQNILLNGVNKNEITNKNLNEVKNSPKVMRYTLDNSNMLNNRKVIETHKETRPLNQNTVLKQNDFFSRDNIQYGKKIDSNNLGEENKNLNLKKPEIHLNNFQSQNFKEQKRRTINEFLTEHIQSQADLDYPVLNRDEKVAEIKINPTQTFTTTYQSQNVFKSPQNFPSSLNSQYNPIPVSHNTIKYQPNYVSHKNIPINRELYVPSERKEESKRSNSNYVKKERLSLYDYEVSKDSQKNHRKYVVSRKTESFLNNFESRGDYYDIYGKNEKVEDLVEKVKEDNTDLMERYDNKLEIVESNQNFKVFRVRI